MKIIVTGAAGAIGSHLSERLILEGHEVIGIDALTSYYNPAIKINTGKILENKGVNMKYLNLATDDISEVVSDVQAVFHLAAQPGISAATPFNDYLENNIIATEKLVESLKNNSHIEVFINASTSSVYGAFANGPETTTPAPTSNYGVTKLAAEQLALSWYRDKKFPVVNLRFFSVYGERERPEKFFYKLIKAIHNDEEINVFEGSESHIRSYTYVRDIIDGCILALDKRASILGETFNLGNDVTNTTGEAIEIIEKIMGKKAKIKQVPKRAGDQLETGAHIQKAQEHLGYSPKVRLSEGLEKEITWYKENVHGNFK